MIETGLEQGRFAGTIRPDDSDQTALGNVQLHIPDHGLALIGDRQVVHGQRQMRGVLVSHGQ